MSKQRVLILLLCVFISAISSAEPSIPVSIPVPDTLNTGRPYSSTLPLATGYYDYETNELTLLFLQDEGLCTISVTNTHGEFVSTDFDSALGTVTLSLSGTPGLYLITVESTSGLLTSTTILIVS